MKKHPPKTTPTQDTLQALARKYFHCQFSTAGRKSFTVDELYKIAVNAQAIAFFPETCGFSGFFTAKGFIHACEKRDGALQFRPPLFRISIRKLSEIAFSMLQDFRR